MQTSSDQWPVTGDRRAGRFAPACHASRLSPLAPAFTLIELLVVIVILGLLAALAVPALKNLGKANIQVSAARQLLDDLGHARQLAISQHTTVYMVFVPGIWNFPAGQQTPALANLLDKQYTGYNFLSLRSVGDQPGQSTVQYLSDWKSLPDGAFIALNKFSGITYITDAAAGVTYQVNPFYYSAGFRFPNATNAAGLVNLPYVAFNYLGQLTVDGVSASTADEFIPLAQGTVGYAADPNTKALLFAAPDVTENPPGNSTNSMFDLIRVDHLTGRATQLQQKVP